MFNLHDLRKSKVWQEAHQEGMKIGKALVNQRVVRKCLAQGMSVKETAAFVELPVREVRRFAKGMNK